MNAPPHDADAIRARVAPAVPQHGAPPTGPTWWYPDDQYELATLQRLIAEGFAAGRAVDYARNAGLPAARARFRRRIDGPGACVRTTGAATAVLDGRPLAAEADGTIRVPADPARAVGAVLEIEVQTTDAAPPALTDGADPAAPWETRTDEQPWHPAHARPSRDRAPHLEDEPVVEVPLHREADGLWAAPQPLLGRIVIESAVRPAIRPGESRDEARSDAEPETRADVDERTPGVWVSRHRQAVRWLRVTGAEPRGIRIEANVRPGELRGAFVCGDDALNRIWTASAATLKLCMQRLMLDGVKRDRMPWIGDQALVLSANAHTWADAEIARDSLTALGRPGNGYVNGIADYSLWWVITRRFHRAYFDAPLTEHEAERLDAFLGRLARDADDDGVLRPSPDADMFDPVRPTGVFIDWGVRVDEGRDATALQLLWFWALRSAAELLAEVGHPRAEHWRERSGRVRESVLRRGRDAQTGTWLSALDRPAQTSVYPAFLAELSGIGGDVDPAAVRRMLREPIPGTPFMQAFALRALGLLGDPVAAVDLLRERWGGMLTHGAETTWEEFGAAGSPWAMYGRPFGKSLAHAWSAGPAALLPELVLGVRMLSDGWRRFTVAPALGALEWAAAVVPTPHGEIVISSGPNGTTVDVPAGTTMVSAAGTVSGPAVARLP